MRVALIAAVVAAASPAWAGWQNTEWDMTAQQVLAAHPSALEAHSPDQSSRLTIKGPVVFGGSTWTSVNFLFDVRGRLRAVQLQGEAPFETLRDRLASQFGQPVVLEDGKQAFGMLSDRAIFRDPTKGNAITLTASQLVGESATFTSTTLLYERLRADF